MVLFNPHNQSIDNKLEEIIGEYRKYCGDEPINCEGTVKDYVRKIQCLLRSPDRKKSANLDGLNLSKIDLSDTNLEDCSFRGCILESVNFNGANLRGCHFEDSSLVNVQLNNVKINDGTSFDNAYFANCSIPDHIFNILEEMQMQEGRLRLSF